MLGITSKTIFFLDLLDQCPNIASGETVRFDQQFLRAEKGIYEFQSRYYHLYPSTSAKENEPNFRELRQQFQLQ